MFTVTEIATVLGKKQYKENKTLVKRVCIDSRKVRKGDLYIAIKGEHFDGNDFVFQAYKRGAVCVIASKRTKDISNVGKHIPVIIVADTVKRMGDIAKFYRQKRDLPIVAITGSAGKTTTKELISFILEKKYKVLKTEGTKNNFIGVPLTLFNLKKRHEVAVVELGTNFPGEIARLAEIVEPDVSVLTNIGDAHLEGLKNKAGVLNEKKAIVDLLPDNGVAVINSDDLLLKNLKVHCNKVVFGLDKLSSSKLFYDNKGRLVFNIKDVTFKVGVLGRHNLYNVLCAIAVGQVFGISLKDISKQLRKFNITGKGRSSLVNTGKYTIFDDTYNANPLSMSKALETLSEMGKKKKVAILADMNELGKRTKKLHKQIGSMIPSLKINKLITVGKEASYIAQGAIEKGMAKKRVFVFDDKTALYKQLYNILAPNDIILVKGSHSTKMEDVVKKIQSIDRAGKKPARSAGG